MKTTTKFTTLIFALALACAAQAETVKLKVSEMLELNAALASLDGFDKEVPQGRQPDGTDAPAKIIRGGYKFAAKAAWALADNRAEALRAKANYDAAALGIVKALSPDGTPEAIDKSPALVAKYSDEVRKLLDLQKEFTLTLISREDLNLDVNSMIPGTVLAKLGPILKKP
jgi:hypothetical protein